MIFKILAVGDVVGNPGLDRVRRSLRYLKRKTGADLVVGCVAALREHKPPMIVIDMGTATTIFVIDKVDKINNEYQKFQR